MTPAGDIGLPFVLCKCGNNAAVEFRPDLVIFFSVFMLQFILFTFPRSETFYALINCERIVCVCARAVAFLNFKMAADGAPISSR